ncbi:MAG: hypothetical protein ACREEM_10825, partial [Blastocatellia bacterium]
MYVIHQLLIGSSGTAVYHAAKTLQTKVFERTIGVRVKFLVAPFHLRTLRRFETSLLKSLTHLVLSVYLPLAFDHLRRPPDYRRPRFKLLTFFLSNNNGGGWVTVLVSGVFRVRQSFVLLRQAV